MRGKHLGWLGLGLIMLSPSINVAKASVITFGGLNGGDNTAFTTYTEGNFTVAPTAGSWFQDDTAYGNPAPSIYDGPIGNPSLATIKVTGTADFIWQSVDYSSNNGPSLYDIRGFLGGIQQFDETGTLTAVFSPFSFTTLNGTHSGTVIDTLDITINPSIVGVTAPTSINLDNIAVNSSTPEPGTLLLIGGGLIGLGLLRKMRHA